MPTHLDQCRSCRAPIVMAVTVNGKNMHMPHHATCPDAGKWRRGR